MWIGTLVDALDCILSRTQSQPDAQTCAITGWVMLMLLLFLLLFVERQDDKQKNTAAPAPVLIFYGVKVNVIKF